MQIIALRSPGLPTSELVRALAEVGVTLTVVTSLDEARSRQLPVNRVIVDGMGETADDLRALAQLGEALECVLWVGFEPPSLALPNLQLINPLRQVDELTLAVQGLGPAKPVATADQTMVPIQLAELGALPGGEQDWSVPLTAPQKPLDRPPPTVAPITIDFTQEEHLDDVVIDADFKVRRVYNWRRWRQPIAMVVVFALAAIFAVSQGFQEGAQISLPPPVGELPTYPKAVKTERSERLKVEPPSKKPQIPAAAVPEGSKVVTPSQPTPTRKKRLKVVSSFDEGRLKGCLRRLGKKGTLWLKRSGAVRVSLRLGVMGDGRVAAATTNSVRFGRKKYRSKRFNACIEGEVVGQQLNFRPSREPTFVKRSFVIKP